MDMSQQGLFWGYVQNNKIYNQANQQVGVVLSEYQAAVDTAKGFQDSLYEHGILKRPKTPEQVNEELNVTIQTLLSTVTTLNDKITKLEEKNENAQQKPNHGDGKQVSGFTKKPENK